MSKITIYSEACNKVDGFRAMGGALEYFYDWP